ncbi:MAG: glycine cleavage system protein GcvH [Hyphomicrobiales bacterium]|nr:glycine cleavage system protein GcvH [Hyphomicrobiales bacterium]MCY4033309.1 glycine cleavage system protein GcvH [Hyphomicrobiales bacterium]MCY4039500.1 glycine cleavage system protein GcvH [Hyphomicrobiales bacterium]
MSERKYTKQHEWISVEGDVGTIGISEHAQDQLGDVVFVELPAVGKKLEANAEMAVVESNKAASDVYAPVSGEVVEVNPQLEDRPELINESAEDKGWLVKLRLSDTSTDSLMSAADYQNFIKNES